MKHLRRLFLPLFLVIFITISSAQTRPFRFAWLSDTHVGGTTGSADLSTSVHDLNTLDDIDFVLLSGDITEMGSDTQLELAKAILDSLKKPYHIIPGNHDTKWSASGCTKFSALWGDDKFVFEHKGFRFIGLHEGPIMKMGDGHFSPEDLRWFDSALKSVRPKSQPLFFVTHYPLNPGIDNWYELTDRLKKINTQAVLVGHGHSNREMNFEGLPGVMGRSNLRARRTLGAYTIVDVKTDTVYFAERTPGVELKEPWHRLPLGTRVFARDTASRSRPDFSMNEQFKNVKARWTVASGYTIASTPAVWQEFVVVGNSSGVVTCYSLKSGKILWRRKTNATVYSSPAAADGKVVVGSSDKTIYCFDVRNGAPLWKTGTGAPVVAAPLVHKGIVYIGGSDGVFHAIDLKNGKLKWQYRGVSGFVETRPLLYQGKIIFGAWDTFLYALDAQTGSLVWKWSNGNPGVLFSPAACWPVASDGKIFVAAPDRYLTAIDASSGATVWRTKRFQVRETVGLSEDTNRVYARCMTDTAFAFSPTSTSFDVLWIRNCAYGYDIDPSMPVEKDGVLFFGTKNGLIYALNGMTGDVLWKHRIGETIVHTLVPLSAHRLVASDLDGKLVYLEAK
jgi:outer membrane protein assembly factor BamB/predicted phosphohydrolase